MNEPEEYDPIAERLQPDLLHDLVVPKYSALASAQPSRLVLVGVWLIFAPMAAGAFLTAYTMLVESPGWADALGGIVSLLVVGSLAVAILYSQTRRFVTAAPVNESEDEDEEWEQSTGRDMPSP